MAASLHSVIDIQEDIVGCTFSCLADKEQFWNVLSITVIDILIRECDSDSLDVVCTDCKSRIHYRRTYFSEIISLVMDCCLPSTR